MRNVNLFAYNAHSEGAGELAEALDIKRIKHENSKYVGNPNKTIINWGASQVPPVVARSKVLNSPAVVAMMSNKLRFFEAMDGTDCRTPDWTVDVHEARVWLHEGIAVCSRAILNGHSGNGLAVHKPAEGLDIPRVPLYTKYVPKKAEYRVHFVGGQIIDIQKKIKRPDFDGQPNWNIRNHANGFIYVRNGVEDALPADVRQQSQHCIANAGLDFGAIDLVYNERADQAFVLEVNTAPGLTGETVIKYAEAFRRIL